MKLPTWKPNALDCAVLLAFLYLIAAAVLFGCSASSSSRPSEPPAAAAPSQAEVDRVSDAAGELVQAVTGDELLPDPTDPWAPVWAVGASAASALALNYWRNRTRRQALALLPKGPTDAPSSSSPSSAAPNVHRQVPQGPPTHPPAEAEGLGP